MIYALIERHTPLKHGSRTYAFRHKLAGPSVAQQQESLEALQHTSVRIPAADPIDPLPGFLLSMPEDTETIQIFEEPGNPEHQLMKLTPRYIIVAEDAHYELIRTVITGPREALYEGPTYSLARLGKRELLLEGRSDKNPGDELLIVSRHWDHFIAKRLDGSLSQRLLY